MTPNLGGWIHTFTVTDTQTHKGGYTIYKITSIVFPRAVPQALTCLVVWKRFHDVKRLHRELNRRHKNLQLPGKVPEPTDASYFKRFDADVIERRKKYILELLDFAAQYPALYKCHPFTQFFSEAKSPSESPLHRLHVEHSLHTKQKPDKTKVPERGKKNISNDFGFCLVSHNGDVSYIDPEGDKASEDGNKNDNNQALQSFKKEESLEIFAEQEDHSEKQIESFDNHKKDDHKKDKPKKTKDFGNLLTPMASIESDDSDYIYEAALEFSQAVQAEVDQDYKKAHKHYKQGVDILSIGSQEDSNDERQFIAKTKIEKYTARVNDIYERFLQDNDEVDGLPLKKNNFQLSIDENEADDHPSISLERSWNTLSKYKVISILGNRVMKVKSLQETDHPFYVMKGIEKPSSNSPTQSIFLPQNVPYMIDLLGYFQSEEKIFLLLRYAEGGLLFDYIKNYSPNVEKRQGYADLFPEMTPSEKSFDLSTSLSVQDSGYVETPSVVYQAIEVEEDFSEIVKNSQELLQSVSQTLKSVRAIDQTADVQEDKLEKCSNQTEKNDSNLKFPEACLKQWTSELAVAIHALHGKGIILKDLHIDNILLGSKGQLLLSYFYQNEGPAFEDSYVHKAFNMKALTDHFVAPERPLTFKSDWWSFGVILYQLLLGLPFKAMHPGNIDLYSCVQFPENIEISNSAQDLLENLIQHNPEERFDFEQIQRHDFFKGIKWKDLEKKSLNKNKSVHSSEIVSSIETVVSAN